MTQTLIFEELKPIPLDERYLASYDGQIYSTISDKYLSLVNHSAGYSYVRIKLAMQLTHRLVASAWLDNPEEYTHINHKDGNKKNNHVENLEWCTPSHNLQHAYDTGLRSKKISLADRNMIKREYASGRYSQRALAKRWNVNQKIIWKVLHDK